MSPCHVYILMPQLAWNMWCKVAENYLGAGKKLHIQEPFRLSELIGENLKAFHALFCFDVYHQNRNNGKKVKGLTINSTSSFLMVTLASSFSLGKKSNSSISFWLKSAGRFDEEFSWLLVLPLLFSLLFSGSSVSNYRHGLNTWQDVLLADAKPKNSTLKPQSQPLTQY